jgi:hypothetical protein
MLEYWSLIKRRFRRPLRQAVLFVGQSGAPIPDRLEEDRLRFEYNVIDLRQIEAESPLRTRNHGDLLLAVLAGGGGERLTQILRRVTEVKGVARERLVA